jgi:hypothetical protein
MRAYINIYINVYSHVCMRFFFQRIFFSKTRKKKFVFFFNMTKNEENISNQLGFAEIVEKKALSL